MQAAAIVITLVALYAALYSFCRVAAESEDKAKRQRARVLQMRSAMRPMWRINSSANITSIEVGRGR